MRGFYGIFASIPSRMKLGRRIELLERADVTVCLPSAVVPTDSEGSPFQTVTIPDLLQKLGECSWRRSPVYAVGRVEFEPTALISTQRCPGCWRLVPDLITQLL
jgi:hypothetical protein